MINSFEDQGVSIDVCNGKYGPYVRFKKRNYKIPKDSDPKQLTKEDCLNLINKLSKK